MRVLCSRCRTRLQGGKRSLRSRSRTAAIATAALILYPFAVSMPLLRVREMGHADETSLEVSPGRILQANRIQRQIRDRFATPKVLLLKVLQAPRLGDLQTATFATPAIVTLL